MDEFTARQSKLREQRKHDPIVADGREIKKDKKKKEIRGFGLW